MTKTLVHRGPDDDGYHISGSLGLGFRRLSIIDLQGGHQPMSDQSGFVWVTLNGEIYNFPVLRKELESYGHVFRTNADTEVIVHGYKQWGEGVLDRLNGMFGIAIWDEKKKKLVVARDRLGIKPVYYHLSGGSFIFGSEIRAIQANLVARLKIDLLSLNRFLRYRYVPAPHTLYDGINKLAPGCMLIVENGDYKIRRWWQFKPVLFNPVPQVEEAQEELFDRYKSAVKAQLISDVPVGLLLSGGLDSGLLLGILRQLQAYIKTYTVGFQGDFDENELKAAARSAELLGFENHSVEIDQALFDETLPKAVSSTEEPIASSSIVPMYLVSKRAREDVKVVLTGQGPDETLCGYTRHLGVRYGHLWRDLPGVVRNPLKNLLAKFRLPEVVSRGLDSVDIKDRCARYERILSLLPVDQVDGLFKEGVLPDRRAAELMASWQELLPLVKGADEIGGFNFYELSSSLPEEQLVYGDKMTMAHGLEARVPFLDHPIVEYATRLPGSYKVRGFKRKWLHKRVCEKVLPNEVLQRPKIGFATPVNEWFRQSIDSRMNEMLLDPKASIYEYLDHRKIEKLVVSHIEHKKDYHKILFSLVVCELFMRQST